MTAAALTLSIPGLANAQVQGRKDYLTYCADCHGQEAKGDGPMVREFPTDPPPDLTVLARHNGGVFPAAAATDLIDGRKQIPSHARLAMPFWGVTLQRPGEEFSPNSDTEVKQRIDAIVNYLQSIQRK